MTVQIQVADLDRARTFYGEVFGSGPEFEPDDDLLEWRVGDGEIWLQVVGVAGEVRPLLNRLRFRVTDLDAARAAVRAGGTEVAEIGVFPGVVRWFDFADPWGNQLGHYEDLADG